jgi:hypothetical protein
MMPRKPEDLMPSLWWMGRSDAEAVVERISREPVPTNEDELRERLDDLPWSTVTHICESFLGGD